MNFENKVVTIEVNGEKKFVPAYVLNGVDHLVSHQDKLVHFDNEADALEYLED